MIKANAIFPNYKESFFGGFDGLMILFHLRRDSHIRVTIQSFNISILKIAIFQNPFEDTKTDLSISYTALDRYFARLASGWGFSSSA